MLYSLDITYSVILYPCLVHTLFSAHKALIASPIIAQLAQSTLCVHIYCPHPGCNLRTIMAIDPVACTGVRAVIRWLHLLASPALLASATSVSPLLLLQYPCWSFPPSLSLCCSLCVSMWLHGVCDCVCLYLSVASTSPFHCWL